MNDRGVAALAYNIVLQQGLTVGVGASLDTQKLSEGTQKV